MAASTLTSSYSAGLEDILLILEVLWRRRIILGLELRTILVLNISVPRAIFPFALVQRASNPGEVVSRVTHRV